VNIVDYSLSSFKRFMSSTVTYLSASASINDSKLFQLPDLTVIGVMLLRFVNLQSLIFKNIFLIDDIVIIMNIFI
jgi:hypothetical protein